MSRDRDSTGRPRNARPRDETGRPLSRLPGARPAADPPALAPADALQAAEQLLAQGHAFHAHEVLEAVWKTHQSDRELWRGLAQLAVGVTHAQRGNPTGSRALLLRASDTLAPWAGTLPYGVAVDLLRSWAEAAAVDPATAVNPPPLRAEPGS